MESRIETLAKVRVLSQAVGSPIRVLPHDEIVRLTQGDEVCSLLLRRVKAREYTYQTLFTGADLILLSWVKIGDYWSRQEPVIMADSDFVPFRRQEKGEVRNTPESVRDRENWEALCYRPGNGTRLGQRDSYERAWEGYKGEPNVKNIWGTTEVWSTDQADQTSLEG